jgi:biopolymer transport protein ExbB
MFTPMFAQGFDAAWLWELLTSGGAAGLTLIGLLVVLSLAALALAVEQFVTLRSSSVAPAGLAARIAKRIEAGDLAAAKQACNEQDCFLGEVVRTAIDEVSEHPTTVEWPAIEKSMEDAIEAEAARLLRRIDYLSVIGNLAPMVGLLGTVIGMIFAFREVAATQGAATAGELASGIYQALVTTVGGLLVAIPSLGAYAVLRNRVDALSAEVATDAERATKPLKRSLMGRGGQVAISPGGRAG